MSATPDPWRALGCAILLRAYHDALAGGPLAGAEARRWLAGDGGRLLAAALDLDPGGLDRALACLPRPAAEQLALPAWDG